MDQDAYGEQTTAAAERGRRKRGAINYDESASVQSEDAQPPKPKRQKTSPKKQTQVDETSDSTDTLAATDNEATKSPAKKEKKKTTPSKKPARPKHAFKATEKTQDEMDSDGLFKNTKTPQALASQFLKILDGYKVMLRIKIEDNGWQDIFGDTQETIMDVVRQLESIGKTGKASETATKSKGRGASTKNKKK